MTAVELPVLRIGGRSYPVVLPSIRDPRLHLAAVIVSIHVLGQVAFGFRVSVPQILTAILTCALIEVSRELHLSGRLVWPASAMLTGSGVALILRTEGTRAGDHWTWDDWHVFALVAGLSLLSKYLVRWRGTHVFNPSNVGLVIAFLVAGPGRIEPLDFWWGPLDGWMAAAYLIIGGGGLMITARLRLLTMAATFWVVLAGGIGVLASSGHCMTAAWSLEPVCGPAFWWVVITSPEVLIFLFFMITDPKTIPRNQTARIAFGAAVAVTSTLLIAPQTTEFGAKVGLLAGLVVMSALRSVFDHVTARGPATSGESAADHRPIGTFLRGVAVGASLVIVAIGIVAAGVPAREVARATGPVAGPEPAVGLDRATVPPVSVDEGVLTLRDQLGPSTAADLGANLMENLAVEAEAVLRSDPSLLRSADHGSRLIEMERLIERDAVARRREVRHHAFDSLHLRATYPDGTQSGPSLALEAAGTVDVVVYDEAGRELSRSDRPIRTTFVLSQATGGRWLIIDEVDP